MTRQELTGLIIKCKNNDHQAFQELVEMHQDKIFRLAFRLLCNTEEAKDVAQETFIRVWNNLDRYDPKKKFTTWIFKITSNLCFDILKSAKHKMNNHHVDLESATLLNISSTKNTEEEYINKELVAKIKVFTDELTPKQKIVFTLRELEDLDISEIITITGQSAKKIKSNLYLARKQIREKIEHLDSIIQDESFR